MKIIRAAHAGMCFGVRDAIALAREQARRGPVTILGNLVHNETVQADLERRGVRVAKSPGQIETQVVMITAHGASDRMRQELAASGLEVREATCPLVHHAHSALASLVAAGFHPVVVGLRDHVEVRGLTGDYDVFDVVLTAADVDRMEARPRFGVVAQTTQPIERVRTVVNRIRTRFPGSEVKFVDTVCQPTKQRQVAAEALARAADVVIVVGGAASNNTRELVERCRRDCARVHQVRAVEELRPEWLESAEVVGLTAGTSTPDDVIDAVEAGLREIAARLAGSSGRPAELCAV